MLNEFVLMLAMLSAPEISPDALPTIKLIKQLGSPFWRERERASVKLVSMGEKSLLLVKKATRSSDYEISSRCFQIIECFYNNIQPTSYGKLPWIDGLPEDYPDRYVIISKYLNMQLRDAGLNKEFIGYRCATKDFIRDLYDSGMKRSEIVELLDIMVKGEKDQVKNFGNGYYYPYKY